MLAPCCSHSSCPETGFVSAQRNCCLGKHHLQLERLWGWIRQRSVVLKLFFFFFPNGTFMGCVVSLKSIWHSKFKSGAVYLIQEKNQEADFAWARPWLCRGENRQLWNVLSSEQPRFGFPQNLPEKLGLTEYILGKPLWIPASLWWNEDTPCAAHHPTLQKPTYWGFRTWNLARHRPCSQGCWHPRGAKMELV